MITVRAAFHVHSDWSYDGRLPLWEVAALFSRHRFDAVFMCEHDRGFSGERLSAYIEQCASVSDSDSSTLLVPGIEYADERDKVHIPVWGDVPFLGEGVSTGSLLQAVSERDGVSVLAHPRRHDAWKTVDQDWLRLCTGLEIWTRKWDGWAPNPRACEWAAEAGLVGVAALDLHSSHQMFPLAMELQIDAPMSVDACVDAVRRHRCRAIIGRMPVAPLTTGSAAKLTRAIETVRRPIWSAGGRVRGRLAGVR
jgi:hypothetical protein